MLAIEDLSQRAYDDLIVFAIGRAAIVRLFGVQFNAASSWYLSSELRSLGRSLVAVEQDDEASNMVRAARSVELLCALFAAIQRALLVEIHSVTTLSEHEITLVAAAH